MTSFIETIKAVKARWCEAKTPALKMLRQYISSSRLAWFLDNTRKGEGQRWRKSTAFLN